ncbi:MAG: hypothetical protein JNM31_05055 [Flavobacteriales bacterium]|nr:hypothetical protein [Flavobacteriales bacterium]
MSRTRLAELERLLAEDPADPFLRYALGLEHRALNDDDPAERIWSALLQDAPGHVPTRHQMALLLADRQRLAEARSHAQAGLDAARAAGDHKTAGELRTLLDQLEDA